MLLVAEVLVLVDHVDGAVRKPTFELLAIAKKLGTPAAEDVLVYEETDEKFGVGIAADRSERYLFLIASSTLTSENRVLPMSEPEGEFELL